MMSILTLIFMVFLVATMRPGIGKGAQRPSRPTGHMGGRFVPGQGVKFADRDSDGDKPGVVTYELMKEHKLPSATRRALRRLGRPFAWIGRRFGTQKAGEHANTASRVSGQSIELQNFLDARNREIARRKAEGTSKRGPEDTLH